MAAGAVSSAQVARLFKELDTPIKEGSTWHAVSKPWLRQVAIFYRLEDALVTEERTEPGKMDNSGFVDRKHVFCIARDAVSTGNAARQDEPYSTRPAQWIGSGAKLVPLPGLLGTVHAVPLERVPTAAARAWQFALL